jgi:hypothetical protein
MFKCELLIGENRYDVTDDLKNWDDFDLSQKRSNYDGVVRTFSTKFEFVKRAYNFLKSEFYSQYLDATSTVIFSLRNNSWEYDEVFRCALDFSTYSDDGYVVSINAIDNTLAAIIKAKKSIQYEYPVADLETSILNYDRLRMTSNIKWVDGGSLSSDASYSEIIIPARTVNCLFPIYINGDPEISTKDVVEIRDVSAKGLTNYPYDLLDTFISSLKDGLTINLSFDFSITYSSTYPQVRLVKISNGSYDVIKSWGNSLNKIEYSGEILLNSGEGLALHFWASIELAIDVTVHVSNFNFSVTFQDRGKAVDIDVISPKTILSKLLDSMTENTIEHSSGIDYTFPSSGGIAFNRLLERTYIMAAESARGLPKAKIYTSYKKFCEWMETEFGYVPIINENTVTFRHRDKLFSSTVVKDLGTKINDYELTVNDSLIYSSVKVGYDKQDYDSINGRDEFRFTNEFSTGLKLTDNTLSLISPYRADAYGIEFLVQKRGEDTTDNDSDNDVFFVDCVKDTSTGILDLNRPYSESQLSGLLSPDTMFNLNYSPRFMLEANKKYIGACTNMLKFTSSDGNSDVSIDGVKETDDFSIPERLFTVSEVEVETSDISAPDDLLGLVSLNNKGEVITGYIKQLKLNIAKDKSASYSLIVKNIKK